MFRNEDEYCNYLNKNKIDKNKFEEIANSRQNYFEYDDKGRILLDFKKISESTLDVSRYSTPKGWFMFSNTNMVLLKNIFGDVYRNLSREDYLVSKYNPVLMPHVAKQFKLRSAEYLFATDKKDKRLTYILTPSFLNKQEELIEGNEILENPKELNVSEILNQINKYCKKENINVEEIIDIERTFIKQTIFNKFIKQSDENNGNWGIIKDTLSARMAPMYDFDCSCEIDKNSKHERKADNGKTELEDILIQYKDEKWLQKYLKEIIEEFNFDKILDIVEEDYNIEIEESIVRRYKEFFKRRIQELGKIYNKIYEEKELEER